MIWDVNVCSDNNINIMGISGSSFTFSGHGYWFKNDANKNCHQSSHCGSVVMFLTSIHEDASSIPGTAVSWGAVCRRGLDPVLLWLWCRPSATAPIQPLTWEPTYAMDAALKKGKKKKKKKKCHQRAVCKDILNPMCLLLVLNSCRISRDGRGHIGYLIQLCISCLTHFYTPKEMTATWPCHCGWWPSNPPWLIQ